MSWIKSYLSNRFQRTVTVVRLNNKTSKSGWQEINVDYPKGLFWVPLFFHIYINDLPVKLSKKLVFYADDTIAVIKSKMRKLKIWIVIP